MFSWLFRRWSRAWLPGLVLVLTLPARPALAQDAGLITNRHYQLKYQVPTGWLPTRLQSDLLSVLRYDSPDGSTRL